MIRIDYATDSLIIEEELPKVFNFISRGARYDRWHFDYHLAAEVLDVKEGIVGSVFSIEELIGGFYLKHVGRVVEFDRNRRFVWLGRFAIFPLVWIGTDFTFEEHPRGTNVTEILYFKMAPWWLLLIPVLGLRPYFTRSACRKHINDELSGVKKLIESGDYEPSDVVCPLEDEELMSRVKRYR
ncbi:MAG: SRPBCC family protein [Actinomycetota bacterium]